MKIAGYLSTPSLSATGESPKSSTLNTTLPSYSAATFFASKLAGPERFQVYGQRTKVIAT